jgi:hypothetical protein
MSGPGSRLTAESYIEKLKGPVSFDTATAKNSKNSSKSQSEADKTHAVAVVAGADYINSIPHAPWPSRAMLKVCNPMHFDEDKHSPVQAVRDS